ncbi:MAG: T9SS type A sorting domain-containing protein [candidate division WOR-3 bacterium]|nr:MAG: T9SS type A sorting domain-containing protein [candidate division WOR-3 bacterium]
MARYTDPPYRQRWQILEHRRMNRYEEVYADTGPTWPYPPGISTGQFTPRDIGDIDEDGLSELLGYHVEQGSTWHYVIGIQESPDSASHPESLVWWDSLNPGPTATYPPCYYCGDLDDDQKQEVFCHDVYQGYVCVFENIGNNQNRLVFRKVLSAGYCFAFGDFDKDGLQEFATAGISSLGMLWVYENAGDDSFALVWDDTMRIANGGDAFAGEDVDHDGKPEFFMRYADFGGGVADFHLFMFEASSNNNYERTLVDRFTRQVGWGWGDRSLCGDVDGDSADEVIWSTGTDVRIYEPTGDNQFDLVWHWLNPTQSGVPEALVDVFDLNGNGYNDIVLSGVFGGASGYPEFGTLIYEMEAIELLSLNQAEVLHGGDTVRLSWQLFDPPPSDSVGLFLRQDTTWLLDTIVMGLAPTDTPYVWVVPELDLDSCWVVAMAYNKGKWQYDECDRPISIRPSGIAEAERPLTIKLARVPTQVRGNLPLPGERDAELLDITGRKVMGLQPGPNNIRHLAPGVYFIGEGPRIQGSEGPSVRKVVIQR